MDVEEGEAVESSGCPAGASSWRKMSIDRLVDAGTSASCCPGAVRGCFSGFGGQHMDGSMGESCSVGPHPGSAFVVQKPQPRRGFVPVGRRLDAEEGLHYSKEEHIRPNPYMSGLGRSSFGVFGACPSGFPGISFDTSPFSTCGVRPPVSGLWDTCNPSSDQYAHAARMGAVASTGSVASSSSGTGPSFSMAAMHGSHQHVLPGRYGGVGAAKDWEEDFGDEAATDGEVSINKGRWTRREHDCFIKGLEKHGEGNWLIIAREFVPSRTRVQVASHAQKYLRKLREQSHHRHGEGEEEGETTTMDQESQLQEPSN
eukprot:TRINITY_DN1656_c0_g2_i1.p1 TRINITY_DN1656_c0_g2~~TRINITY_DN1656_c0_g2_i1.p1  ORF type:complete len:314 (-),score=82.24 TRINITY_DN1656_c0_g2_i1:1266-2207(-)